ncbi:NAD(P)H-dependent oxidoreductase [Halomonas cerina]|uniref:Putative NADPH-quinone reductase n=1 Tax=Halomonas cerina TaxID=447424 RepID=A0A839VAM8_9GAMM|nr:NAD(P)H-dependent oxidoreductase [Halomonas cerina]MBB3191025.1 putative NADPH-quinone reductase [Halomonas cerina]
MTRCILLLQGHPDPAASHLCHALADHYIAGAQEAGHEVRQAVITRLDFPLLRSAEDWKEGRVSEGLAAVQQDIAWCDHLALVFPLWLGDMPALVKGFLEQVMRPHFAFEYVEGNPLGRKGLKGRSARVVVTMGMPAAIYRHIYRAHSIKALERNVLGFVGFSPVRETLIGSVESLNEKAANKWFTRLEKLGSKAG